jgi:hypothetical protein
MYAHMSSYKRTMLAVDSSFLRSNWVISRISHSIATIDV